jgi:hypothetical protein
VGVHVLLRLFRIKNHITLQYSFYFSNILSVPRKVSVSYDNFQAEVTVNDYLKTTKIVYTLPYNKLIIMIFTDFVHSW